MLSSLTQDVRYALRTLARAPGFTLVCVLTIALAIGANTAIFTVVNGVLLKPLGYPDAGRLVTIGQYTDAQPQLSGTTSGNFYDWLEGTSSFASMAAWGTSARNIAGRASAERVVGIIGTGALFDVLGNRPLLGRTFSTADGESGAEPVLVLSHGLWQRLYGGDPSVIGQTLSLAGDPFTIIGVMPADFAFPDPTAEYWIPRRIDAQFRSNRDQYFLMTAARLKDGLSIEQARLDLDTVMDRIRAAHPQATQNARAGVQPMKDMVVDGVRTRLLTLMGAVAFILLIACANLGNLLLARAAGRRREIAIRHALGARPLRIVRQMLTESVVLAIAGGLAGIVLGRLLLDALLVLLPPDLPRAGDVRLDLTVLTFTLAASCVSGLAFGILPALHLAGNDPADAVRNGARGSGRGRAVRSALVVSEVALAVVLLAGAGLLVRSFAALLDVHPGFRAERLLTLRVAITPAAYQDPARRVRYFEDVLARLRTLPGVDGVAMTTTLPASGRGVGAWFNVLARPLPPTQTPPGVPYRVVAWDALQTLGIPLLRGRYLTPDDRLEGERGVLVSDSVARRFWPDGNALGQRIYLGAPDNRIVDDVVIVGIVGDVKQAGLDERASEAVYLPHTLVPFVTSFSFALRTSLEPGSLTAGARAGIREIDPTVPMFGVQTMDETLAQSVRPARSSMLLIGLLAAVALLLALLGVFSVLSYTVTQRTTELGIRMALGAGGGRIALLVLGAGMLPVVCGVALGLAGALALTRFMASLLFGVTPTDPATFASVATLIILVAAIASYLPARRAAHVDPITVLRQA